MVSIRQAQRGALMESTPQPIPCSPLMSFSSFSITLSLGPSNGTRLTGIITFLYAVLCSVRIWIPEEEIRRKLPADFKDYPDTTVILYGTELRCQWPSSPLLQSEVFSSDKSHCTLKGLIGIAPHGALIFVSALYAGSISDKQITHESGVLNHLKPWMAVMVDSGFLIDDIVPCKVYRPAFLSGRPKMSASKVRETQAIAVHVECFIRRVKEQKCFDSVIPLRVFGSINQLYTVACLLTNYENGPLVKAWGKKPEV